MANAKVTIGESTYNDHIGHFASVTAECSDCDYKEWTGGNPRRDWSHMIDHHLAQHEPGRALDIDVDWEPSASCSVCTHGGDVQQDGDGLVCQDCGTTWNIDGTFGYRTEAVSGRETD